MTDFYGSLEQNSIDFNENIQWDDRCHVIKLLQEQIQGLLFYKTEYEQMKQRAEIAEKLLEMRETEIKLKFDELDETFKALEDENQKLKAQAATRLKQPLSNFGLDDSKQKSEESEGKENKWKLKYKALLRMTNGDVNEAGFDDNLIKLQTQVDELKRINEEKSNNIASLTREMQNLMKESNQAKTNVAKYQKQVEKTQAENEVLKQENQKLKASKKQRDQLLQHNRSKQEKTIKTQKQLEQSSASEIEEQKKKCISQSAEITRLTNMYDTELRLRKQSEKKLIKMAKNNEEIAQRLNQTLTELESEKRKLSESLIENQKSQDNLKSELEQTKSSNEELKSELTKSEKIQKKKEKLEKAVKEMQCTIDQLQTSISSAESDSSARCEQIKNLLIRHLGGTALQYDWGECMTAIDEKLSLLKTQETMIQTINGKMMKMKKKVQKMNRDNPNFDTSQSMTPSLRSDALSDDTHNEPQIIEKIVNNPFTQINSFRHAVSRRINKLYFKLYDDFEKVNKVVTDENSHKNENNTSEEDENDENATAIPLRSLILFSILIKRWATFKKEDQYDKTSILEYLPAKLRKQTNKLPLMIQQIQQCQDNLKSQQAQNGILTKANQQLLVRAQQIEIEMTKLRQETEKSTHNSDEISQRLEYYENRCNSMIDPQIHESVKKQLQSQIAQCKSLEKEVSMLKAEIKKLVGSIDGKHDELSDMQESIASLADENLELQQHIHDLSHELEITQAALKERTKELLSIERRLMREKENIVIVKDSIPLTPQYTKSRPKQDLGLGGNFLTENIRGSLVKMQNRILNGDEAI